MSWKRYNSLVFVWFGCLFVWGSTGTRPGDFYICALVSAVHEVRLCVVIVVVLFSVCHVPSFGTILWLCACDWFLSWDFAKRVAALVVVLFSIDPTILLLLRYSRVHLNHLGVQPFTHRLKRYRANQLVKAFPRYNKDLVMAYSQASAFYNAKDLWL